MNIGQFARQAILSNPTMKNDDILVMVRKQFPEAKTTYACIAWYKSDLRKKGQLNLRTPEIVEAEIEATKLKLAALEEEFIKMCDALEPPKDLNESKEEEKKEEQQEEEKV